MREFVEVLITLMLIPTLVFGALVGVICACYLMVILAETVLFAAASGGKWIEHRLSSRRSEN